MNKAEEIAKLEKRLKELKAQKAPQKVGLKEGMKRSFKIFGDSASTVMNSMGQAGGKVLGGAKNAKVMDTDDILKGIMD